MSRTRVQSLIREGCVTETSDLMRDPNHRIVEGQIYAINVPDVLEESPLVPLKDRCRIFSGGLIAAKCISRNPFN